MFVTAAAAFVRAFIPHFYSSCVFSGLFFLGGYLCVKNVCVCVCVTISLSFSQRMTAEQTHRRRMWCSVKREGGNKTKVRGKYESGPPALEWLELLLLSRSLAGINVWIHREAEVCVCVCVWRVTGSDWRCFPRQGGEIRACRIVLHYSIFLLHHLILPRSRLWKLGRQLRHHWTTNTHGAV